MATIVMKGPKRKLLRVSLPLLAAAFFCLCFPFYFVAFHLQGQEDANSRRLQKPGFDADDDALRLRRDRVRHLQQSSHHHPAAIATSPRKMEKEQAPYAYAFVIGGIHEDRPAYKGFLYDILIAVNLLRKLGSKADFWIWTQMSSDSSRDELPKDDLRHLNELGVHVASLGRATYETFSHLMLEKFRPLQLTQYKRIMYLDADIMPLVNLDYLFHLSDPDHTATPTFLRPNLIVATRGEPCNGGLFVLKPEEGGWEQIEQIIQRQKDEGRQLPYPHFDYKRGWGYHFQDQHDAWEAMHRKGTAWHFHASHSDQGLIYYWTKFVKQDVSIVIGDRVQNWMPSGGEKPRKEMELTDEPLAKYTAAAPMAYQDSCDKDKDSFHTCIVPYRDIAHFMGKRKPWQIENPRRFLNSTSTDKDTATTRVWFEQLIELNGKLNLGIDLDKWDQEQYAQMKESPLGTMPKWSDGLLELNMTKTDDQNTTTEKQVSTGKESKELKATTDENDLFTHASLRYLPSTKVNLPPATDNMTVAYAISLIKCGDFQTPSAGLTDASLVLRHSIHQISRRNPESGSKYDYKMYAIVHRDAEKCSQMLKDTGFEVVVVDPPIMQSEIEGEHLRKNIHREWCCGSDEFIKLFAYALPEEIVVHVDIDFAFYKPMDDLFDAILYDKDSPEGKAARERIERETPTDTWPDKIGAFWTRDWPQVAPEKFPAAFQAGFLVARRDPSVLDEISAIVKRGNYTDGWGWNYGWGNAGYGGYVGSMAMQGVVAYYYDHVRPGTAVELNQCRYNHMGMDVRYRAPPNFRRNSPFVGKCRNSAKETCEDCMVTDFDKIYNVHYTLCKKPWQCMAIGHSGGRLPGGNRATAIDTDQVNLDHCMELIKKWHDLRSDLENQLYHLTNDQSIKNGTAGPYKPEVFNGHCNGDGNKHYVLLSGSDGSFKRIHELYDEPSSNIVDARVR